MDFTRELTLLQLNLRTEASYQFFKQQQKGGAESVLLQSNSNNNCILLLHKELLEPSLAIENNLL